MLSLQHLLCSTILGRDGLLGFTLIFVPDHFCEYLSWQGTRSCCGYAAPPLLPHVPATCSLPPAGTLSPACSSSHSSSLPLTISAAILKHGRLCHGLPGMWEVQRGIPRQSNSSPESKIAVFSFVLAKICEEIRASSYTHSAFLSWHYKLGNRKGFWENV